MASTEPVTDHLLALPSQDDSSKRASYIKLGAGNGLLIGLAVVIGFWLPKVSALSRLPVDFPYAGIILNAVFVVAVCALTGWLTSRVNKIWLTLLLWLGTAVIITVSLGGMPLTGQNWFIWLTDPRFKGLSIYEWPERIKWWYFVVGSFLFLFIIIGLALLQDYRLERAQLELKKNGRWSARTFLILFLPALLAALGAYAIPDLMRNAAREGLAFMQQGIEGSRSYTGDDLFGYSLDTGFNYSALEGVLPEIEGPYRLMAGEMNEAGSSFTAVAHFDNGAWINCFVNIEYINASYLNFCADASLPYTAGFAHLLTGRPFPETCRNCAIEVDAAWQSWLADRAEQLTDSPQFEFVAQQGSYVLMRASSPGGDYAIECMFKGIKQVSLLYCEDA
ncbi:MAG TPA: hypothetical protein ENJ93_04035 [Chloroflexi bacterium]|nr:hypothetical protein [Chloroflexota bacterium]